VQQQPSQQLAGCLDPAVAAAAGCLLLTWSLQQWNMHVQNSNYSLSKSSHNTTTQQQQQQQQQH
jgi:hypothetical protein